MNILLLNLIIIFILCSPVNSKNIFDKLSNLNIESNSYKIDYSLQKSPSVTIQDIVNLKINELSRLGKNFKYSKELALGSFIIDVTENKIFFKFLKKNKGQNLEIYNNNSGKAYKSIPLKDIPGIIEYEVNKIEDYFSVSMKDFNKHLDEKSFIESLESIDINNIGDNPPIQHTTNKPRILLDKEIVNLSLVHPSYPDLGKVLNRGLAMQKTRDQNDNPRFCK